MLGLRDKVRKIYTETHLESFCRNVQTRQAGEFCGKALTYSRHLARTRKKIFGRVTRTETTRKVPKSADYLMCFDMLKTVPSITPNQKFQIEISSNFQASNALCIRSESSNMWGVSRDQLMKDTS